MRKVKRETPRKRWIRRELRVRRPVAREDFRQGISVPSAILVTDFTAECEARMVPVFGLFLIVILILLVSVIHWREPAGVLKVYCGNVGGCSFSFRYARYRLCSKEIGTSNRREALQNRGEQSFDLVSGTGNLSADALSRASKAASKRSSSGFT